MMTASGTEAVDARGQQAPVAGPPRSDFQPEIQGLRALAVLLVVGYHLWPTRLTGGFVGVDAFFVISGYLITAHIVREVVTTGRLSVTAFWARRIRRLLPIALAVSFISACAVYLVAPATVWNLTVVQVIASALYVQNWVLASDAVDYSAMDNDATIAQHYWSLSIEEQFYIAWPLLIVAVVALVRLSRVQLNRDLNTQRVLVWTLVAIGVASFVFSVVMTADNQARAYFVTPTRVWEFVFGALIALLPLRGALRGPWAITAGWAAVAVIVWSGFTFSSVTAFPGWIAVLPVAATAVALITLRDRERHSAGFWLTRRPVVFVGDISYALYLWHWPLIVLAGYALDEVTTPVKVGLLALGIALSWVSKVLIEDPLRSSTMLRSRRRSFTFACAGMALSATVLLIAPLPGQSAAAPLFTPGNQCYGPGVLNPANNCGPLSGGAPSTPPAEVISENREKLAYPGCQADADTAEITTCSLGADPDTAVRTIAVVGDSHATSWFPAFDLIGEQNDWSVLTFTKSGCPFILAQRNVATEQGDRRAICDAQVDRVLQRITDDPAITTVVTASYSSAYSFTSRPSLPLATPAEDGFTELWTRLTAAGKSVVVMGEVPRTVPENVPTCLAENDDPAACSLPRSTAASPQAMSQAARSTDLPNVTLVDLTDQFCDAQRCYAQLGSVIVYRDKSHISRAYALALAPAIQREIAVSG